VFVNLSQLARAAQPDPGVYWPRSSPGVCAAREAAVMRTAGIP